MIQLEVDPHAIKLWMKQHFVDANDWVMNFNTYAMGYFDKRFTSKPYLFSSNYIVEQSGNRYKRCEFIDSVYRRFLYKYPQKRQPAIESYNKQLAN